MMLIWRVRCAYPPYALKNRNGKRFPILPGMVANVEIKTGQKTVLDYLIKPLNKVKEALRER